VPIIALKPAPFKPSKPLITSWDTWRKGLNTLLRETEIDGQEMTNSTNLLLVGSGIPTKRWGSQFSFQAGQSNASINGVCRFVLPIKDNNDNWQILSWTDAGSLTKQSGGSYTPITGASWPSGYNLEATELGQKIYIVSQNRELTRYDFTNLVSFLTISPPTGLTATNLSLATGTSTFSWRITSLSPVGESIGPAANAVSLATLPQNLNTTVRLNWNAVTPAAGASLIGYNIYRGYPGSEVWIGGVGPTVTTFDDGVGIFSDPTRIVPSFDTTGGPKAKYIVRFQDRIILAGISGSPTKILISGRYPNQERFDWFGGGGFILVEPDSGEDITGIGIYYRTITATQTIVVFKERSVWEVVLDTTTIGNYAILNPTYRLLTGSQGCSSHRSITPIENDIYFANKRGVYILRYEPQLFNVINANELSAKIRPFFESLAYSDIANSAGFYGDKKFVLSLPTSQQAIVFDRERLSFTGPWKFPWNLNMWRSYIDAAGDEHWLAASNSNTNVYEFSTNYPDDVGIPIVTAFKSKKDTFQDWTLFKTITEVYMNFANVIGNAQINLYIENRSGQVVSAKSFTIIGASSLGESGIGINQIGLIQMGLTTGKSTVTALELQKKAIMYKTARTLQIEILTGGSQDSYQLLNTKSIALPQSRGNNPTAWNI